MSVLAVIVLVVLGVFGVVSAFISGLSCLDGDRAPRFMYAFWIGWWMRLIRKDTPITLLAASIESNSEEFGWKDSNSYCHNMESSALNTKIQFNGGKLAIVRIGTKYDVITPPITSYEDYVLHRAARGFTKKKDRFIKTNVNDKNMIIRKSGEEAIMTRFGAVKNKIEKKALTFER